MDFSNFEQWWQYIYDKALSDGRYSREDVLEAFEHYITDTQKRYLGMKSQEEIYRRTLTYWHQYLFDEQKPPATLPERYQKTPEISGGKSTVAPGSKATPPDTTKNTNPGQTAPAPSQKNRQNTTTSQNQTGPAQTQNTNASWATRTGATGATYNVASQKQPARSQQQPDRSNDRPQQQSDFKVSYDRCREGIPKNEITPCLGVDSEDWPFFSLSFHHGHPDFAEAYRMFVGDVKGEAVKAAQKHFKVKFLQNRDVDHICFWVEDEDYHNNQMYAQRVERAYRFLASWASRSPLVFIDAHIQTFEDLEKSGPIPYPEGTTPIRPPPRETPRLVRFSKRVGMGRAIPVPAPRIPPQNTQRNQPPPIQSNQVRAATSDLPAALKNKLNDFGAIDRDAETLHKDIQNAMDREKEIERLEVEIKALEEIQAPADLRSLIQNAIDEKRAKVDVYKRQNKEFNRQRCEEMQNTLDLDDEKSPKKPHPQTNTRSTRQQMIPPPHLRNMGSPLQNPYGGPQPFRGFIEPSTEEEKPKYPWGKSEPTGWDEC